MNKSRFFCKIIVFIFGLVIQIYSQEGCIPCSTNPLEQIYPNQNQCVLLAETPVELRNLSYGIYPNCDPYNTNRFNYNKRFNVFPHVIFTPETNEQVVFLLQTLKKYNLPFAVRSGGHCYGPGSLSDGYIIDLRNFNKIIPDIANQTVFIGSGNRLGQVIQTLGNINFAIPTGSCSSVGVAGLALGGGIGLLARQFGLTSDAIIEMTVVLADGSIVLLNKNNYPDLFWALSGAGANSYGIVLGFTFKMQFVPEVSLVTLKWFIDSADVPAIFNSWQKWVTTLPTSISSEFNFRYQDGRSFIILQSLKVGAEPFTEWQPAFAKFNPNIVFNYHGNYLGAATRFASVYTFPFSKVRSKFIFKPLSRPGLQVIIDHFTQLQQTACEYIVIFEIGASIGGAISKGDSAYFPRKAFAWIFEFIYWNRENQTVGALNSANQVYRALAPFTSEFSYANLIDFELGPTYLHAYYGDHVERLIKIKNEFDPENIFNWRQGIPLKFVPQSNLNYRLDQKYCFQCKPGIANSFQ